MNRNTLFNKASNALNQILPAIDISNRSDFFLWLHQLLIRTASADSSICKEENLLITYLIEDIPCLLMNNPSYASLIRSNNAFTIRRSIDDYQNLSEIPAWFSKMSSDHRKNFFLNIQTIVSCMLLCSESGTFSEQNYLEELINNLKQHWETSAENGISSESSPVMEAALEEKLDELNSLIGLYSVKKEIMDIINIYRINKLRPLQGLPKLTVSRHMIFTGNPGTGKTTVARIFAEVLKEIGVLSSGQLIETDRSGMVAAYVGQTAIKTKDVIDQAIGGVLFIDEAYALNNGQNGDFGQEAIDTLVKYMEDNRENLIVIAAGYPAEMEKFLQMNPGLRSRFSRTINFQDYSAEEMMLIFKKMLAEVQMHLTSEAEAKLAALFQESSADIQFGNARGVRNVAERLYMNQATRILSSGQMNLEEISLITEEDIHF